MIPAIRKTSLVFGDSAEGNEARVTGSTRVSASGVSGGAARWWLPVQHRSMLVIASIACAKSLVDIHTELCRPDVNADTMSVSTSPLRCLIQWTTTLLVSKLPLRFHAFIFT